MKTAKATLLLLRNKLALIIATVLSAVAWEKMPTDDPSILAPIILAVLILMLTLVSTPVVRLLLFPESAEYAEHGHLRDDIGGPKLTPALLHYWFSTATCFLVCLVCFSALLRLAA